MRDPPHLVHGGLAEGRIVDAKVQLACRRLHGGDCSHLVHGTLYVLVCIGCLHQLIEERGGREVEEGEGSNGGWVLCNYYGSPNLTHHLSIQTTQMLH